MKMKRATTLNAIAMATTFALLNLLFRSDYDGATDFGIDFLRKRQFSSPRLSLSSPYPSALADDNPEDYKELIIPDWLAAAVDYGQGEAAEQVEARLKAAMVAAASESSRGNGPPPPELSQYTLEDLVAISHMYRNDFGILMYDPENDDFLLLYNGGRKDYIPKLVSSFQNFVILLRHVYPGRFRGKESEELGELDYIIVTYIWLI